MTEDGSTVTPTSLNFDSLICEPYETVFANLPCDDADFDPNKETLLHNDSFRIRNLDTGEARYLGRGALSKKFADAPVKPDEILGSVCSQNHWAQWWAEKRQKDARLMAASESGSICEMRDALATPSDGSAPASVNARALYGWTALHHAVAGGGSADCVQLLLSEGADLDGRSDAGLTPLHIACQRGRLEIVELLLDCGSDACCESNDRNLPIHLASAKGRTDVVRVLLERHRSAPHEQLLKRNSLGQRPAEVSFDIQTAECFLSFEKELGDNSEASREGLPATDHYASRTPFKGAVLVHNARADTVKRLLHKMAQANAAELPEEGPMPLRRKKTTTPHSARVRAPFAHVPADSSNEERVGPDSFEYVDGLGKGAFGQVFRVKHRRTHQVYAMKVLCKDKLKSSNVLKYAETERNVLSYMNHPYIVSLYFAFQTPSKLVLVLQYCPGGNLQQLIDRVKRLPEPVAQVYTAEMLLALVHLHERHILFRDMKPENIVFDEGGHAVLTDFGLSKEGVQDLMGARSFCGSPAFLAPEVLARKGHGRMVDVYGLGVLLFTMLTGRPPFYYPDRTVLFTNIKHAPLQMPQYVSACAASFIASVMNREPSRRLGANSTTELKEHDFFDGLDFEALMRREVCVPSPFPSTTTSSTTASTTAAHPENPLGTNAKPSWKSSFPTKDTDHVKGWSFAAPKGPMLSHKCSELTHHFFNALHC